MIWSDCLDRGNLRPAGRRLFKNAHRKKIVKSRLLPFFGFLFSRKESESESLLNRSTKPQSFKVFLNFVLPKKHLLACYSLRSTMCFSPSQKKHISLLGVLLRSAVRLALASLDTRRTASPTNALIAQKFIQPATRFLCSQVRTQKLAQHGIIKNTLCFSLPIKIRRTEKLGGPCTSLPIFL